MWTCPNCGRTFKNTNQNHFCNAITDTIDSYINLASEEQREVLQRVRATIGEAAPDASEKMSWKMPTFWQGENIIQFASFKNHMGLYPGPDAVAAFADQLEALEFKFSKGAIQIPWSKPMPYELITEITKYCVRQALLKKEQNEQKKSKS